MEDERMRAEENILNTHLEAVKEEAHKCQQLSEQINHLEKAFRKAIEVEKEKVHRLRVTNADQRRAHAVRILVTSNRESSWRRLAQPCVVVWSIRARMKRQVDVDSEEDTLRKALMEERMRKEKLHVAPDYQRHITKDPEEDTTAVLRARREVLLNKLHAFGRLSDLGDDLLQ